MTKREEPTPAEIIESIESQIGLIGGIFKGLRQSPSTTEAAQNGLTAIKIIQTKLQELTNALPTARIETSSSRGVMIGDVGTRHIR